MLTPIIIIAILLLFNTTKLSYVCDQDQPMLSVKKRHSLYTTSSSNRSSSHTDCKSDANISYNVNTTATESGNLSRSRKVIRDEEYYKKYEHDEIPVKDESSFNDHSFSEDNDSRAGDNKDSITNSDLDKLEMKILRKMSQELQTEDTSVSSLDSNIKLFKTTVQQIFDNFYSTMHDFDAYKKKFNDILEKNKGDSFAEMEDFIRDMIQNIGSSGSTISNRKVEGDNKDQTKEIRSQEYKINVNKMETDVSKSTIETFLNDNYLTDSTFDNSSSKCDNTQSNTVKREETFNIYLLNGTPCVEIKMTNRDMLSEINIRNHNFNKIGNQLASAENIKKLAAKKLQLENYDKQCESHIKDRDIPVRVANPKKNIHLDEDFVCDEKEEPQFFIFKICNYICRKFRKN